MSNVISLEAKRKQKFQPIRDSLLLVNRAVADERLSRQDIVYLMEFVSFYLEKNRPFNEYIADQNKRRAIEKLIAFGYLEKTEPFDWIVDEAFLGFSVGDSLGWFQEIRINGAMS